MIGANDAEPSNAAAAADAGPSNAAANNAGPSYAAAAAAAGPSNAAVANAGPSNAEMPEFRVFGARAGRRRRRGQAARAPHMDHGQGRGGREACPQVRRSDILQEDGDVCARV